MCLSRVFFVSRDRPFLGKNGRGEKKRDTKKKQGEWKEGKKKRRITIFTVNYSKLLVFYSIITKGLLN